MIREVSGALLQLRLRQSRSGQVLRRLRRHAGAKLPGVRLLIRDTLLQTTWRGLHRRALRDQAERAGLRSALAAIEAALSAHGPRDPGVRLRRA